MMDIKGVLLQWFIIFFDKSTASLPVKSASGSIIKNKNISNKKLAKELHKPIIRKFEKKRQYYRQYLGCWQTKGKSKGKPNEILVDKGSEFYNRSMKSWLEKNAIEIYSTDNEGKPAVVERFIRTLKNKIYYMT